MKEYYTDTKYMFNTVYAFIQKKPIIDNCLYIGGVSVSRHDVVKMVGKLLLVMYSLY